MDFKGSTSIMSSKLLEVNSSSSSFLQASSLLCLDLYSNITGLLITIPFKATTKLTFPLVVRAEKKHQKTYSNIPFLLLKKCNCKISSSLFYAQIFLVSEMKIIFWILHFCKSRTTANILPGHSAFNTPSCTSLAWTGTSSKSTW